MSPKTSRSLELSWRFGDDAFRLRGSLPKLMGIVNVTPDSFSDGGKFASTDSAIEQGLALDESGADILDVGGESTRPYSQPVSAADELARVVDVVSGLAAETKTPISIDTSKAAVAAAAIEAGARIVNDVTGLAGDPAMLDLVASTDVGVCVMHMQGTPQTMQDAPDYGDVVVDIKRYLADRLEAIQFAGVASERICLDPGIGFGKTHEHNIELLVRIGEFHELGAPLLVGHSRKGFLGKIIGDKTADRGYATTGVAIALARAGVHVIRVHDVRGVRDALLAFSAVGGLD